MIRTHYIAFYTNNHAVFPFIFPRQSPMRSLIHLWPCACHLVNNVDVHNFNSFRNWMAYGHPRGTVSVWCHPWKIQTRHRRQAAFLPYFVSENIFFLPQGKCHINDEYFCSPILLLFNLLWMMNFSFFCSQPMAFK